jgi:hypothetical protein
MKAKKIFAIFGTVALLTLLLGTSGVVAFPPKQEPEGEVTIASTVSSKISYQGWLTDPAGNPLDGTYTMRFRLYDAETGGTMLWDSGDQSVSVDEGLFNVKLDIDHSDFNGQELWLEIQVGNQKLSRQELLPVPYALSLRPGADIIGSIDGDSILKARNESSADYSSGIYGYASADSGITAGVYGVSDSPSGRGVYGYASADSGTTYGVYGKSNSPDGRGVYGYATYGVYGRSDSTFGKGVYGWALADNGTGVHGCSGTPCVWDPGSYGVQGYSNTGYGVYGWSDSTSGAGVYGTAPTTGTVGIATADSGTTYGVFGNSASTSGRGVYGYASATSGAAWGVYGKSDSTTGRGVYGTAPKYGVYGWASADSGDTYGVYGWSASTSGRGVYGLASATSGTTYGVYGWSASTSGRGVVGSASATSGTTYGVYGESDSSDGYGGYFYNTASGGVGLYARGYGKWDADLVLGGTSSTNDEGCIYSDPNYVESDIWLLSNDGVVIRLDRDGSGEDADFEVWDKDANNIFNIDESGTTQVQVLQITGGSDLSEQFEIQGNQANLLPSPGMVVCIDPEHPGKLIVSTKAYDRTVAGIISGAGGIKPGMLMGQSDSASDGWYPVALVGRVYVWADASYGSIEPGDLLTTSDTPGHAMKVTDYERAKGAIIGKAMSSLEEGQGLILVLVTLQ